MNLFASARTISGGAFVLMQRMQDIEKMILQAQLDAAQSTILSMEAELRAVNDRHPPAPSLCLVAFF